MAELLRLPAVIERTRFSRSTIYDLIERGLFPRPRRIGVRAVAWLDTDIDRWMTSRPQTGKEPGVRPGKGAGKAA